MKQCALIFILVFGAAGLLSGTTAEEARQVLVVCNTAFEGSRQLANYYAEKRDIPSRNIIGLSCSSEEEISREAYDQDIVGPLRRLMVERGCQVCGVRLSGLWGQAVRSVGSGCQVCGVIHWDKVKHS